MEEQANAFGEKLKKCRMERDWSEQRRKRPVSNVASGTNQLKF
ncbi:MULTISPECIES: hypothetical protein [Virgibacillus]|uniref:Uncharacterized protein n=1 Tax=Virgibacillus dokdonensis TaxID=302167 RepID=A0A2K9J4S6_9BACI|nr:MULTISPECIES: hypothetical protein [Virgibacillus]AUJ25021.1 hypothetical protein A21D_01940 [Virgibacillus dokdonensis]